MSDIYYCYIQMVDQPKITHFVRGTYKISQHLLLLKAGDILNIKGLGRLKIMRVDNDICEHDEHIYTGIGIICSKLGAAWATEYSESVEDFIGQAQQRLKELRQRVENWS